MHCIRWTGAGKGEGGSGLEGRVQTRGWGLVAQRGQGTVPPYLYPKGQPWLDRAGNSEG